VTAPFRQATANVRFIQFDVFQRTADKPLHVSLFHKLADLHSHAIGALARDAKLAMQLHPAHAMARRDEKENRVKPHRQRRAGFLKDRSGARVEMIATMGAAIRLALFKPVECGIHNATGLAGVAKAEPNVHDML